MMMLVVFLLMFYPPTNAGLSMSIDGGNNQEKVKFLDFVISDDSEYDLGENIKEMSEENLHIAEVGDISGESAAILSKMESVDEDEIEMELKKADERIPESQLPRSYDSPLGTKTHYVSARSLLSLFLGPHNRVFVV